MSEESGRGEAPELHAAASGRADTDADIDAAKRAKRGKRAKRAEADDDGAGEPREDALAALDVEAQRRWRRGDLAGAESVFREIIRRDPKGRWAQLAYGDLFALVRQTGDRGAELKLWREYLRRHPRGPHADDANAGTCRRQRGDAASACWREYLEARPSGAFRSEAKLALDAPPGRGEVDDEVAEERRP